MSADWNAFLDTAGAVRRGSRVIRFGDPGAEAKAVLEGDAVVDLGHLSLIRVDGEDGESFLQGQLTNDVAAVNDARAQLSAWCSAKGRVLVILLVLRHAGHLLLELPGELAENMLKRLRMFVLRARVGLEDVSDQYVRIGVTGRRAVDYLSKELHPLPDEPYGARSYGAVTVIRLPGAARRYQVLGSGAHVAELWNGLGAVAVPAGADAWDLLDMEAGIASVNSATSGLFVPQMLNLDRTDGVSFTKGCYVGQEIVARTQHLGRIKRRMYLARIDGERAPSPGEMLHGGEEPERISAQVVTAGSVPEGGFHVLAVIATDGARHVPEAGIRLQDGRHFALESLPYALDGD